MAGIYPREAVRVKVKVRGAARPNKAKQPRRQTTTRNSHFPPVSHFPFTHTHRNAKQRDLRNGANSPWIHKSQHSRCSTPCWPRPSTSSQTSPSSTRPSIQLAMKSTWLCFPIGIWMRHFCAYTTFPYRPPRSRVSCCRSM